jgi:hypothetical protein
VAEPVGPQWVEGTAGPLTGGWRLLDTDAFIVARSWSLQTMLHKESYIVRAEE